MMFALQARVDRSRQISLESLVDGSPSPASGSVDADDMGHCGRKVVAYHHVGDYRAGLYAGTPQDQWRIDLGHACAAVPCSRTTVVAGDHHHGIICHAGFFYS